MTQLSKHEHLITGTCLCISELEPIAVDFLENLAHQLKGKDALRELNISRAIDQTTEALQALRQQFGAEKVTPGTWRDYLRWLMDRNFYLDPGPCLFLPSVVICSYRTTGSLVPKVTRFLNGCPTSPAHAHPSYHSSSTAFRQLLEKQTGALLEAHLKWRGGSTPAAVPVASHGHWPRAERAIGDALRRWPPVTHQNDAGNRPPEVEKPLRWASWLVPVAVSSRQHIHLQDLGRPPLGKQWESGHTLS